MRRRRWLRVAALAVVMMGLSPALAAVVPPGPTADEARVPAGTYYVGRATGELDYRKLANASTPGFLVGRGQVTQALFAGVAAWGTAHGYTFEMACKTCVRDQPTDPLGGVSWRDAALLANALSEMDGLDPVYRDATGQPIRSAVPPDAFEHVVVEPSLTGFRLPAIPEWQIALRGADRAMENGTYGAPPASPNALGLTAVAGPLAEWTASSLDLGNGKAARFVCNVEVDGVRALSQCVGHPAGWFGADVGVRLVRKAPPEAPPVAAGPTPVPHRAAAGAAPAQAASPVSTPAGAKGADQGANKRLNPTRPAGKLSSVRSPAAQPPSSKQSTARLLSATKPSATKPRPNEPFAARPAIVVPAITKHSAVTKARARKVTPPIDPVTSAAAPRG